MCLAQGSGVVAWESQVTKVPKDSLGVLSFSWAGNATAWREVNGNPSFPSVSQSSVGTWSCHLNSEQHTFQMALPHQPEEQLHGGRMWRRKRWKEKTYVSLVQWFSYLSTNMATKRNSIESSLVIDLYVLHARVWSSQSVMLNELKWTILNFYNFLKDITTGFDHWRSGSLWLKDSILFSIYNCHL